MITSDGPTNHWKKGTVNAALNSSAHFVGGNNFLNCSNNNCVKLYLIRVVTRFSTCKPRHKLKSLLPCTIILLIFG